VPLQSVYNGRLLQVSGTPVTSPVQIRFSHWTSGDAVEGDRNADGSLNISAPTFAGWQEVHTVTPDASGYFSAKLGSNTPLPAMDALPVSTLLSLHLEVDVKPDGSADSSYELLDTNPGNATADRSPILSVPFALNADKLDQRDVCDTAGCIPVLDQNGRIANAQGPAATTSTIFTIDFDDAESGDLVLQFGTTLAKTLTYSQRNGRFEFNDDLAVQGDLTVTGLINGVNLSSLQSQQESLKATSGQGLTVTVTGGNYRLNGTLTAYTGGGNIAVNDNAETYVFFSKTGLQTSTAGFPNQESFIPVAVVNTAGGSVTSVTDRRILMSDDREQTEELTFSPLFHGAGLAGDGTNNVGRMMLVTDGTPPQTTYRWTSTRSSLQDFDIVLTIALPTGFLGFDGATPISVDYRTENAVSADANLAVTMSDGAGNAVNLTGTSTDLASPGWTTTLLGMTGTPTFTAGQTVTMRIKFSAKNDASAWLGKIRLRMRTMH
jgi:hypothetical protein